MIIRNATVYTASSAISAAVPFLLLPILTRELTPGEYGLVSMFTVFSTIVGAVFGLSVNGAVNVSLFNREIDHKKYIGTAIQVLVFSSLSALFILYLVSSWLIPWLHLPEFLLFVAVGMVSAQFLINVVFVIWQVEGHALRYGLLQIFISVFGLAISLVLVLVYKMGWEGRVIGMFAPIYMVSIVCILYFHVSEKVDWQFNGAYAKDVFKFGVALIPHSVGYIFISMSDRMMISANLGSHEVGAYMASMQVALGIGLIADAVSRALSPWVYGNIVDNVLQKKTLVIKFTYLYFLMLLLLGVSFFIFSPYLALFLGEKFREGDRVLAWASLGSAFSGMYLLVVIYIFFEKKNEWLSAITITVGLVNLPLSYFMIIKWGAVGGAKAYAFSQLIMFIMVWVAAQKCHPMPWKLALRQLFLKS